jgi:predicted AlkP superfamily pyrophosphatase or phosphodiesterase
MMKRFSFLFLGLFLSVGNLLADPLPAAIINDRPKLVVTVVIDQFRADYLLRFSSSFLPASSDKGVGGFQYLMQKGAHFPQGQFDILQNMTGPGHATILTGAYPYRAGVPLNHWYDVEKKESVYCAQDSNVPAIEVAKEKKTVGTSPKNLLASTVGDELKNAGYASKVVSIALKDRAAIFLGGHRSDVSLWFDGEYYQWISSKFYFPDGKLPSWIRQLNKEIEGQKGKTLSWKKFPHQALIGKKESLSSPYGLEITERAVEAAVESLNLGRGKSTDLLAVGFSSFDYLGHEFGPNSVEMEQMTIEVDRVLAKLLNFLAKKVPGGLKNVLVVLTADHGIPPLPEEMQRAKIPAGRLDEKTLTAELESKMVAKFGKSESAWISASRELNFFLNPKALEEKKADRAVVEDYLKRLLLAKEGIAIAFTSSEYFQRRLPPGAWERQILKTYFPKRSGDVVAVPAPFYMAGEDNVMHMTPYKYDSTVPILFAGSRIRPGVYASPAEVVDIAPTLSFLVGTIPPSLSEGRVLSEILR